MDTAQRTWCMFVARVRFWTRYQGNASIKQSTSMIYTNDVQGPAHGCDMFYHDVWLYDLFSQGRSP